jgi:hypothetical protein
LSVNDLRARFSARILHIIAQQPRMKPRHQICFTVAFSQSSFAVTRV